MKKRIMVIGPSKVGKTTIVNALNDYEGPLKHGQDLIYGKNTIDVPGAYIENAWMYNHAIALAQHASKVLVLVDQSNCIEVYAPGFAKSFTCPVIGVITKSDLMPENEQRCREQLKSMCVSEPYFYISFKTGEGIDCLKDHLFKNRKE